jgi:hypothetical protein
MGIPSGEPGESATGAFRLATLPAQYYTTASRFLHKAIIRLPGAVNCWRFRLTITAPRARMTVPAAQRDPPDS